MSAQSDVGNAPAADAVQQRFEAALTRLVEHLERDEAVIAAMLCGSLSHSQVWRKSDIDLIIVTVDDAKKVSEKGIALAENDVNIHASVMRRESFRKLVESSRRNSFSHSYVALGRLLFSKDPALERLLDGIDEIGAADRQLRLLELLGWVLPCLDKARKWLEVKRDVHYTALYVLQAASGLAGIEVTLASELAGREVLHQALRLNPQFFQAVYLDVIGRRPTEKRLAETLRLIDEYLLDRQAALFGPVLEYLVEAEVAQSASEIEHHFARTHGVEGVLSVFEWLADHGIIAKSAVPCKVSARSSAQVQELAFRPR
ncbi:MAG TPA: hypothetical protein VGJ84_20445 [Polyangiaceae bacterium]